MKSISNKTQFMCSLVMSAFLCSTAYAGETNVLTEKSDGSDQSMTAIEQASLASQLADYGRDARSAIAFLLAGEIVSSIGAVEAEFTKAGEASDSKKTEDKATGFDFSAEELFAQARNLAGSNEQLLAAIEVAASKESKGLVGSPATHEDSVRAGRTDVYTLEYEGGRPAEILVIGDGDTDLDLTVYDEDDNFICDDDDSTDTMYCEWRPRWTGEFRIEIKNLGDVYNDYVFMTN
ncbi:MAG: hypothetical protein ABJE63_01575 [Lentilitoribacter sp.]